jgi:hypothetical protein
MSYRKQNSLIEFPKTPDSPSISHYSMQFELARSIDELNSGPQRKLTSRISEADFNDQLLKKLDSVIENPIYTETDRQRIFKYVSFWIIKALLIVKFLVQTHFPGRLSSAL